MSVSFYMDVHVPYAITRGLRLRGVDVMTAQEDGAGELSDPELLDRATELGRLLFTQDDDLLREANRRQQSGEIFAGVVYAHQQNISIRECIDDLELIAGTSEPEEWVSQAKFLPLR